MEKWRPTDRGKQEEITNAIVSFVTDDLQALSVVESKAFRNVFYILAEAVTKYSVRVEFGPSGPNISNVFGPADLKYQPFQVIGTK